MAGVVIFLIVLFSIAAGLMWLVGEMYKLDREMEAQRHEPCRTVERTVYGRDWNRIMEMTKLEKTKRK